MPNLSLLRKKIDNSGLTVTAIAQKSGLKRETLYNKLQGDSEFKASEISALTFVLQMSREERDEIFFASQSELYSLFLQKKQRGGEGVCVKP